MGQTFSRLEQALFEESPPFAETLTALRGSETCVHYTDDRLKNLKLKARLKKLEAGGGGGTNSLDGSTTLQPLFGAEAPNINAGAVSLEREFNWQEKVFGAHEVQAVRENYPANHVSHHRKNLCLSADNLRKIEDGIASGQLQTGPQLFTKVSADGFPNVRTQILEEHKLLDLLFKSRNMPENKKLPKILGSALGYQQPISMHIMAALEEGEKKYEVELACVSALESGALEITPRLYSEGASSSEKGKKPQPESGVQPASPDGSILFSLPGGAKYEFTLSLAGKPVTSEDKKKALARIRELDLKAVSLRRNLAGHGFDGFKIEDNESEVFSVFAEILSYEPKKAHPNEDYVIREVNAASVPPDVDLWEERCLLKSCQKGSTGAFSRSMESYYVMYEFQESNLFKFKYRSEEALGHGEHAGKRACTLWSSVGSTETAAIFNHGLECHFGRQHHDPNKPQTPVPPRLLLQVYKKDFWERHIFLGYSYVDIPNEAGEYDVSARMWAPCGTIREQLTNKYCGAAPTLLSPQYIAGTDCEGENPRNRSCLKTLTMDLSVVRQVPPRESRFMARRRASPYGPGRRSEGAPSRSSGARRRTRPGADAAAAG
ncbi:unnamed protein product [Amoebophrya sp. A25]|nr:unnamed protein product [Amoebophrya sp. A25]|eukprot:GSA25T00020809001.1